jgi:hypothetical protein
VHYRSLAKRVRGVPPAEGRWTLRSVWIALAVLFVGQLLALYVFGYEQLLAIIHGTDPASTFDPQLLALLLVAEVGIVLLCLLPLLRGVSVRNLLLGNGRLLPAIGWGLGAWVIVMLVSGIYRTIFGSMHGAPSAT